MQNIHFILENCLHTKLIKIGNKTIPTLIKQDEFISNENMENLRNLFELILKNLKMENEKIKNILVMNQKGFSIKNIFSPATDVNLFNQLSLFYINLIINKKFIFLLLRIK